MRQALGPCLAAAPGLLASHAAFAVTRFVALAAAAEKGVDRAGVAKLHAQLLRELALFEFQARPWGRGLGSPWRKLNPFLHAQLSRAVTVCGANRREQALYAQQHERLEQGIAQV